MAEVLDRTNQVGRQSESWRPPSFKPVTTLPAKLAAVARRFLDPQAGSIWNDLAVLLPQSRGLVLDVGAGAQPYRRLVPPGVSYKAIDYVGVERYFGYSMPDTTYYEGDKWPIADGSVDVILCTETIEHVPEPSVFLTEAFRCLKHEGRLLLTVPFAARWHYVPHDYWRFTPSGLERLRSAAGFGRIAVYSRGNAVTVACYKVMALMAPFLVPQRGGFLRRSASLACGILALPLLVALGAVAALSLRGQGGEDCLGYTAVAYKVSTGHTGDKDCF